MIRGTAVRWLALGVASAICVVVFGAGHVPAPMLLGPIFVGMVFALRGMRLRFAAPVRACAQGVTGVLIAQSIRPDTLTELAAIWPLALALVAVTLGAAMAAGLWLARVTDLEPAEAIWGFFPGMAGAVIAMSEERGLDARTVAVIQVLRLVTVILGMSFLAVSLGSAGGGVGADVPPPWIALCLVALAPVADRYLARIPAASMFVPMLAGAVLAAFGVAVHVPVAALLLAYFIIGANVGLGFDIALMRRVGRAVPAIVGGCVALMVLAVAMGGALAWMLGVDTLTGVLATVPGSIDAVAAIAWSEGADLSMVMPLQVLRLFAVVLIGPSLAVMVLRMRRAA